MHGIIDSSILTTERGIWAVKWSFAGLFLTAFIQVIIVYYSGSIALLADTIHNFGAALTAIPFLFAFMLVWCPRRDRGLSPYRGAIIMTDSRCIRIE